jgi:hypothetical protein
MAQNTLVYWIGIIGIPGKGPNYKEKYDPNRCIGEIIERMRSYNLGEKNKRIEIFKFKPGHLDKYDKNDIYWSHNTTLSEYLNIMGSFGKDIMLVYCIV